MTFEAGPWHGFGNELLDRLLQAMQHLFKRNSKAALSPILSNYINSKKIYF